MTPIQTALCNIRDEIMLTGYFNRFYEYAEAIERGQQKFPQVYVGEGNYDPIYDFDVNGSGYIRKTSSVQLTNVTNIKIQGCSDTNPLVDLILPLRLVAAVPKSKLNDNAFSDDKLCTELIAILNAKQAAVQFMQSVSGRVASYNTDRDTVWSNEVRGIDTMIDLNLSFISIDFYLTLRALQNCFTQNCDY